MAIVEVKVPQLSESVAEATLLQWKKKPGDAVAIDEILIEVETDKVVLEVPAPAAGVLMEIVRDDGSTVVAGELIARLDTEGKAAAPAPAAAPPPAAAAPRPAAAAAPPPGAMSGVAMPAAAKMMAEQGMAAAQVSGTGRDGRITKGDVIAAAAAGAKAPAAPPAAAVATVRPALPEVKAPIDLTGLADRPEQRVPMSRLRAAGGRASGAVAVDRGHPDDVQRSQHAAGAWSCATSTRTSSRRSTGSSSASCPSSSRRPSRR